jgi:formylglycine-generating enzyme required for sulfatase activity
MKIKYILFAILHFGVSCAIAQVNEKVVNLGNGQNITLVYIASGHYLMGSTISADDIASLFGGKPESYFDELPQHKVTVKAFWIGKYEITKKQFRVFVRESHYKTDAEKAGWAFILMGRFGKRNQVFTGTIQVLNRTKTTLLFILPGMTPWRFANGYHKKAA